MKRIAPLVLLIAVLTGLFFTVACGGGGGSSSSSTAKLRVVNSIADSAGTGFDFLVAGASFTTDLQFNSATSYTTIASGTQAIEVRNTGVSNDLINVSESFTGGDSYTFVALGTFVQPSGVIFTDTTTAASSGNIQLRVINASPTLGTADVYITAPGVTLNSVSASISSLGFGSGSGYQTMAAGKYEIRVTYHGSKSPVWYDYSTTYASGAVLTLILQDGQGGGSLPPTPLLLTDATS
jgi:hypothetical protein